MFNIHWGVHFRFEYFTECMLFLTEQTKTKHYQSTVVLLQVYF